MPSRLSAPVPILNIHDKEDLGKPGLGESSGEAGRKMLLLITKSLNLFQMLIEFTHPEDSKGKSALTYTSESLPCWKETLPLEAWAESFLSTGWVALSQTHLLFTLPRSYPCSSILAPTGLWVRRPWCLVHFADIKKQYPCMNEWLTVKIIWYSQPQWHVLFSHRYLWHFTDIYRFSPRAQLCAMHNGLPV